VGAWLFVQDDWHVTNALTLNLGLRYDLMWDMFQNQNELLPFMEAGRPQNVGNYQPRVGSVRTGGRPDGRPRRHRQGTRRDVVENVSRRVEDGGVVEVANDGRPDFTANPVQWSAPTFEQAKATACLAPSKRRHGGLEGKKLCWCARLFAACERRAQSSSRHLQREQFGETSIGFQRQFGSDMVEESDYVYTRGRNEGWGHLNMNIAFNPATGVNYPYAANGPNRALLPYPDWGIVALTQQNARSAYHGLVTTFTKRMSNRWQASATYTLAGFLNAVGPPFQGVTGSVPVEVPFELAQDLGGEWSFAEGDQRHRMVLNGIWQVGHGFQLSGIHYSSAGDRTANSYGGDLRISARVQSNASGCVQMGPLHRATTSRGAQPDQRPGPAARAAALPRPRST
jgi:hypothetical protein